MRRLVLVGALLGAVSGCAPQAPPQPARPAPAALPRPSPYATPTPYVTAKPSAQPKPPAAAADIKNIAAPGAGGGSILAALFLQRFIEEGTPWAHLDIAGVTWRKKSDHPSYPEGASGFGVRLLNRLVADRFEG